LPNPPAPNSAVETPTVTASGEINRVMRSSVSSGLCAKPAGGSEMVHTYVTPSAGADSSAQSSGVEPHVLQMGGLGQACHR
jgi:hypothetical protein